MTRLAAQDLKYLGPESNFLYQMGKLHRAIAVEAYARTIRSAGPVDWYNVLMSDAALGKTGATLSAARHVLRFSASDYPNTFHRSSVVAIISGAREARDMARGDYLAAQHTVCEDCSQADAILARAAISAWLHDPAAGHATLRLVADAPGTSAHALAELRTDLAMAEKRWSEAAAEAEVYQKALVADYPETPTLSEIKAQNLVAPIEARALAKAHEFEAAGRVIAVTKGDCVPCVTARGEIAALQGKTVVAQYWFARAVALAPDIPFADTDWGKMLLREGKFSAAIVKFSRAHKNGPHFADPLELWGETLIAKNRSDLAVAKFKEAAQNAPNWGRLHLKWGEALLWSGHRDEAKRQFAIASHLFLTPIEKSQLASMEGMSIRKNGVEGK
ncbi:MAG: hypothetical protein ACP5QR_08930 [Rhizomicrobium sp.]